MHSEDLLVRRAVQRDREAFASLYDRHVERVYKHVYYVVFNKPDAEDITQEVFIRAWKYIDKYRYTGAPFVAWLIKIAHNLIVDHYKARKKARQLVELEAHNQTVAANPATITEANLEQRQIRKAILKLKGEKQKVIKMHFIDDFSYKEIAELLNKSEGAVRVIQYRALIDLRRILMWSE